MVHARVVAQTNDEGLIIHQQIAVMMSGARTANVPSLPAEIWKIVLEQIPCDREGVRTHAAFALASKFFLKVAGGRVGMALRALESHEEDGDMIITFALRTLSALRAHAAPHAPAIAERLEHEEERVRRAAVRALSVLGEHAAPHVRLSSGVSKMRMKK